MGHEILTPNTWMVLPFAALLLAIALGPLLCPDWWGKHYAKAAFGLGGVTLAYYAGGLGAYGRVLEVTHEYVSFIALIGSLFVVSGGIHIRVKGEATPVVNTLFLLIGAIAANLLGTTGASMLLIRPWIRMNKYRITAHHIVFFIFVVSNAGGCLTPVGDPPLFLGYLKGVPFWWIAARCWPMWVVGVGWLLGVFYVVDLINYRKAPGAVRRKLAEPADDWRFDGLWNLAWLGMVLGAIFIRTPLFLREGLMLAAAAGCYFTTEKPVHEANHFNFHPIREVAILFVGIFATMIPALDWLRANATNLASASPAFFFWGSGTLSSFLDNAPTYLSFLNATFGLFIDQDALNVVLRLVESGGADPSMITGPQAEQIRNTFMALQKYHAADLAAQTVSLDQIRVAFLLGNAQWTHFITAISVASVFFGANTYVGNGPNFMVKAIADHQKVNVPGFVGYILRFTLPVMLPMLFLVWLLFFRR